MTRKLGVKMQLCALFAAVGICTAVAAGAAQVPGGDFNPPPWRGEWSTTTQYWDFSTEANPTEGITPDGPGPLVQGEQGQPYPPGYLPSTRVWVYPFGEWIDIYDDESGRQGIWPLSGEIEVIVDNHEPPNPEKWMHVQLTWKEQDPSAPIDPNMLIIGRGASGPDGPYNQGPIMATDTVDNFGWHHTLYEWMVFPNPVDETFTIAGEIDVDELVIDTWCIPEPASMGLLALGGLALLRRRRR